MLLRSHGRRTPRYRVGAHAWSCPRAWDRRSAYGRRSQYGRRSPYGRYWGRMNVYGRRNPHRFLFYPLSAPRLSLPRAMTVLRTIPCLALITVREVTSHQRQDETSLQFEHRRKDPYTHSSQPIRLPTLRMYFADFPYLRRRNSSGRRSAGGRRSPWCRRHTFGRPWSRRGPWVRHSRCGCRRPSSDFGRCLV